MSSKENLIPEDLAIIELSGLLTAWQTPESDKSRGLDPYLSEHYSSLVKLIPQLEAMLRQIAILAQRDDIGRSAVASEYPQIRLSVLSIRLSRERRAFKPGGECEALCA